MKDPKTTKAGETVSENVNGPMVLTTKADGKRAIVKVRKVASLIGKATNMRVHGTMISEKVRVL